MEKTTGMGSEVIVREIPENREQGCWTTLPGTDEHCEGKAVVKVYGLPFCEIHGAEARAGALAELYFDASLHLERLGHPDIPGPNPAAERVLQAARAELDAARVEVETAEDAALLRAYPFRRDLMDEDFRDIDYRDPHRTESPEDWCRDHRTLLHKLMRLAYEEGATYIVEALQNDREHVSQQLAYVLVDYRERVKAGR